MNDLGPVTTTLNHSLITFYMKGIAYFFIMIQLAIMDSRGFKKFKKRFIEQNIANKDLIGKGIAYRFNNFKSQ